MTHVTCALFAVDLVVYSKRQSADNSLVIVSDLHSLCKELKFQSTQADPAKFTLYSTTRKNFSNFGWTQNSRNHAV